MLICARVSRVYECARLRADVERKNAHMHHDELQHRCAKK